MVFCKNYMLSNDLRVMNAMNVTNDNIVQTELEDYLRAESLKCLRCFVGQVCFEH